MGDQHRTLLDKISDCVQLTLAGTCVFQAFDPEIVALKLSHLRWVLKEKNPNLTPEQRYFFMWWGVRKEYHKRGWCEPWGKIYANLDRHGLMSIDKRYVDTVPPQKAQNVPVDRDACFHAAAQFELVRGDNNTMLNPFLPWLFRAQRTMLFATFKALQWIHSREWSICKSLTRSLYGSATP